MAFAFGSGERIDVGARRLAREGAEKVRHTLAACSGERARQAEVDDSEDPVHDARRMLKRLRALVRLVAGPIGDEARTANAALRDAGRGLSAARDASVVLQTFDALAGDDPAAAPVRSALRRARTVAARTAIDERAIAAQLAEFEGSIDRWTFADDGWAAIEPGVHRTYRAGRRALDRARKAPESEVLHELRKRTKDQQYQLALLRELWPQVIGGYHDALSDLGALLGEDHDLWVLAEKLQRRRALDVAPWLTKIDERRLALRSKTLPLAARIFHDRPRIWTRRLACFWAQT